MVRGETGEGGGDSYSGQEKAGRGGLGLCRKGGRRCIYIWVWRIVKGLYVRGYGSEGEEVWRVGCRYRLEGKIEYGSEMLGC